MLLPFLAAFGVALLAALVGTPCARYGGRRLGLLDQPGGRHIHGQPIPRVGGMAIFLAFVAGETTAWLLIRHDWIWPPLDGMRASALLYPGHANLRRIFVLSAAVVLLGLIDDIWTARNWVKFLVQAAIAFAAVSLGFRIEWVTTPWGASVAAGAWSIPITVLWIMVLMNGLNFVDGVDGLAAGLTLIASLALFVIAVLRGNLETALLLTGLAGAVLGFLRYNLHPASIFMGDAGSLFLGLSLALITIIANFKSAATIALIVPMTILALPLLEITSTTLRRIWAGRPVFSADRKHLHHRLLDLGLSAPRTVAIFYLYAIGAGLIAIAAVLPDRRVFPPALLAICVAGASGLLYLLRLARRRARKGAERE